MRRLRIVYVGPLAYGNTCAHRMEALARLGHDIVPVDTSGPGPSMLGQPIARLLNAIGLPQDHTRSNDRLLAAAGGVPWDLVYVDKGRVIYPQTLRALRRARRQGHLVSYSPDDMMNWRNQSWYWRRGVGVYDVHITTKTYNVGELRALGARRTLLLGNGFDPMTHRPVELSDEDRSRLGAPVGFVGTFEEDRYERILSLARAGVEVKVRGAGWEVARGAHPLLKVAGGEVLGEEYAKVICSTRVNLCFLRKVNRDLQTTRSVEIPACGAFMLGERTSEHLSLFREGEEAEFFSTDSELLDKTVHHLEHETERVRIAHAGRVRCLRSGYSNDERMRALLAQIGDLLASS